MKTIELLENLLAYYKATRSRGHTTAMLQGANNTPKAIILAASEGHARQLKQVAPQSECVSMRVPQALRGRINPLLVDNFAMEQLLADAVFEIRRLEKRVHELSNEKSPSVDAKGKPLP
jgi:hypothetical protein